MITLKVKKRQYRPDTWVYFLESPQDLEVKKVKEGVRFYCENESRSYTELNIAGIERFVKFVGEPIIKEGEPIGIYCYKL